MLRSLTSVQSQRQIESMPSKTKPRSRTKPPEERRNELMNAAQQLFLQPGVARVTIDFLCALLQAGSHAHTWSVEALRFGAGILFSALHGVVDDAHIKERHVNRARLVHRLQQLCFRAVALPPG